MTGTTVVRKADWLVTWDEAAGSHSYRRDADLAFADGVIKFVGAGYDGPADAEIDGHGSMVMPGLVDIHTHAGLGAGAQRYDRRDQESRLLAQLAP